jgi:hypothetical protein
LNLQAFSDSFFEKSAVAMPEIRKTVTENVVVSEQKAIEFVKVKLLEKKFSKV